MTNVNVNLSAALHTTLSQTGVNAYAVFFDSNGINPTWAPLVLDGTPETSPSLAMPATYKGGKVYFLIQSGSSVDLQTQITTESQITWQNASGSAVPGQNFAGDFRYDSFELTLSSNSADQGNLTSVNGFGIPMSVSIPGVGTRGYDIDGSTLFSDIIGVSAPGKQSWVYSDPPLSTSPQPSPVSDGQRMVLSPTESVGGPGGGYGAFNYSDWQGYTTALQSFVPAPAQTGTSPVVISGWFNGAPSGAPGAQVWHNAGYYDYTLSFDGNNFWLSPAANSQIQGFIQISPTMLQQSVYSTIGTANVYLHQSDPANGILPYLANMNTGDNNQWGEIFTQFLTGFTGGYWGGTGNAHNLNPLLPAQSNVDLSKTWNWDPTYAFGHDGTNTLTSGLTGSNVPYDKYAEIFFEHSNSYGAGYSDNLMKAYVSGGPLISLWNGTANVSDINVTLYADGEVPGDYTPAVIYNAPPGTFGPATQYGGDGNNINLSFVNAAVTLQEGTPVTISWYSGGTNGTFTSVTVPTNEMAGGVDTIFQNWNVTNTGTGWTLTQYPTPVATPGSILINQLPGVQGGGVSWYQIAVGDKTFNLYATTGTNGQFVNPAGDPTAAQVDGLATVTATAGPATVPTFTVNFLGSSFGLDASLLTRLMDETAINDPTNGSFPQPWAPAIGSVSGDVFTQLAPTQTQPAVTPPTPPPPPVPIPTLSTAGLAFGWIGETTAPTPTITADIAAFTNKTAALDVAHVVFASTDASAIPAPVTGAADLDGNWFTSNAQFGNGNYTATMTEYLSGDTGFLHPVAKSSFAETFVVSLSTLTLSGTASGGLALADDGSGTQGNWIRLQAGSSTLHNGTLLAYATDASGHLIGRDGSTGPGVTLDDAVLAEVGSVASDSGAKLFGGGQSVYLPLGEEMHFAILTDAGKIQQLPPVNISGAGTLSLLIGDGKGSMTLTANVNNTLSHDAALAGSQRQYDEAWVYLTKGQTVGVEVAGSAQNVNTAHFVHIDVNAATGDWSVGGVAYGNTDAFRTAVQQNWDPGYTQQNGGGTFHNNVSWTPSGGSGFYAPVLQTQNGDIFVIGAANSDGQEHIRLYGENVFAFEDLKASQGGDFDYNDMIMKLTVK